MTHIRLPTPASLTLNSIAKVQTIKHHLWRAGYVEHTREHKTNIMVCLTSNSVADVRKIASETGEQVIFQTLSPAARLKFYAEQDALTIDDFNQEENWHKPIQQWVLALSAAQRGEVYSLNIRSVNTVIKTLTIGDEK